MTKRNSINAMKEEVAGWRHALHENPGIKYEEEFASNLVQQKLTEWGIPFKNGFAKTGIVGVIEGRTNTSNKTIGLRADMDALPILETSGQPWASKIPGKMHACGHDGHTAILLGAAKYLNETRNFDGRVLLIFQPAEEGGRGAFGMMNDGLFKNDLRCDSVYALHNWPYMPIGTAGICAGAIMASVDHVKITVLGRSGHAAYPHMCIDPILIGTSIVQALQSIVSRMIAPQECAVLSITNFNAGTGADNIIPDEATIIGTVRTLSQDVRNQIENRIRAICSQFATAYGASVSVEYERSLDPTINHAAQTVIAADAAARIVGNENVDRNIQPSMGGEDFGGMLLEVPGAYIRIGQAVANNPESPHNRGLHNSGFDFNDDILPIAMDYFAELVESGLPIETK